MTTRDELDQMVANYNNLIDNNTSRLVYVIRYQRQRYPYALKTNGNIIVQGTKEDLYIYLMGAVNGINTYKQHIKG